MSSQSSEHPDLKERLRPFKRKHRKPWQVLYRAPLNRSSLFGHSWHRFGRYKDEATAKKVLAQKAHCRYFEYKILPPDTPVKH